MDEIGRLTPEQLQVNFTQTKVIIQAEEMWERVPASAREVSSKNLKSLVKFAYFGGFIDMAGVGRYLLVDKQEKRRLLARWYAEVREQGCWLC